MILGAEGQPEYAGLFLAENVRNQAVSAENALCGLVGFNRLPEQDGNQFARENFRFDELQNRVPPFFRTTSYYTTNRAEKP